MATNAEKKYVGAGGGGETEKDKAAAGVVGTSRTVVLVVFFSFLDLVGKREFGRNRIVLVVGGGTDRLGI